MKKNKKTEERNRSVTNRVDSFYLLDSRGCTKSMERTLAPAALRPACLCEECVHNQLEMPRRQLRVSMWNISEGRVSFCLMKSCLIIRMAQEHSALWQLNLDAASITCFPFFLFSSENKPCNGSKLTPRLLLIRNKEAVLSPCSLAAAKNWA